MRAVVLDLRPDAPASVSQREFDRARTNLEKWAAVPSARQICARLNVSWRPLLAALFEPDRDVDKFVSHKQRTAVAHGLSDDQVAAALRIVAARLGVTTLRPAQYDAERAELMSENQRRYRHGAALTLATANQIMRAAGDWDRALAVAGLNERPALTGSQPSEVSYHEAVRRFLESQGAMPTSKQLEAFAAAQRFPLPRTPVGGHQQALLDVQAAFAAEHRWAPATIRPRTAGRPTTSRVGPRPIDVQDAESSVTPGRTASQECSPISRHWRPASGRARSATAPGRSARRIRRPAPLLGTGVGRRSSPKLERDGFPPDGRRTYVRNARRSAHLEGEVGSVYGGQQRD